MFNHPIAQVVVSCLVWFVTFNLLVAMFLVDGAAIGVYLLIVGVSVAIVSWFMPILGYSRTFTIAGAVAGAVLIHALGILLVGASA